MMQFAVKYRNYPRFCTLVKFAASTVYCLCHDMMQRSSPLHFDSQLDLMVLEAYGGGGIFCLTADRLPGTPDSDVTSNRRATFVRSYIEEYSCVPPPLFIIIISIIQVTVYVYYSMEMNEWSANGPTPIKSPLIYNPHRRYEAWRFLSYQFIHIGLYHILFNILMQLILGVPLEMVHKWYRVGVVYSVGVIAGSLGSSLSDPRTYLAGASGGVYALIAAHLATVVLNYAEMDYGWLRLLILSVFGVTDFSVAVYERYSRPGGGTPISYSAHLAGAFVGLTLGVVVLRNLVVTRCERVLRWISFCFCLAFFIVAVGVNVLATDYYPVQKYN
ncbi:rhomboid-related protein 2-like [Tropilaelaps mercedesae]|uniref:rhomboid protease n=1 Tax=Tropilaelaps mercedesae TaxID=418985 RepID=A0A1V9WZK8_9ACAR|nr:rhomboid-related protein 2-like [Tropilaelaps mercedesae]